MPDEAEKFSIFSETNTKNSFEFNGIVFNGTSDIGTDLYIKMFGWVNVLLSLLTSKHIIVNLSGIVISYLFDKYLFSEDNYVTNGFPVICSFPQLYFDEALDVTLPEVDSLELYIDETLDCLDYTPPALLPEEEYEISEVKNKMIQKAYNQYKTVYHEKLRSVDEKLNEYKRQHELGIDGNIKQIKNSKLAELNIFIKELKTTKEAEIKKYEQSEKTRISDDFLTRLEKTDNEIETLRKNKFELIEKECQEKLDTELAEVNRLISLARTDETVAFQNHIETLTRQGYTKMHNELDEYKTEQRTKVDEEMADIKRKFIEEAQNETNENKRRSEELLIEHEKTKKDEITFHYQTEYLTKYNGMVDQIDVKIKTLEDKKLEELYRSLDFYKASKTEEINRIHTQEKLELKEKLEAYESQKKHKIDVYLEEYKRLNIVDAQINVSKETQEYKEEKMRSIEDACAQYETQLRTNAESSAQIYANSLKLETNAKHAEYREQQLMKINTLLDEEYAKSKLEKLEEQTNLLKEEYNQLDLVLLDQIHKKQEIKLQHLAILYAEKQIKYDTEIEEYKTSMINNTHELIRETQESENIKLEAYRNSKLNEINYNNDLLSEKLHKNRKVFHDQKIQEITAELETEKQEINNCLVAEYRDKLVEQRATTEKHVCAENERRLAEIVVAHERDTSAVKIKFQQLTNEFQEGYAAERQQLIRQFETEKTILESDVIRNHNANLAKLEREFQEARTLHTELMKKAVISERTQMLDDERQSIKQSLISYRTELMEQELAKVKQDVSTFMSELRRSQMEVVNKELDSIKIQKIKEIDAELTDYKARNEKLIHKEFSSFLRVLKETQ